MSEQQAAPAIPAWLDHELDLARQLFLVGDDWEITVQIVKTEDFDGQCESDPEYLNATLRFRPELDEANEHYRRRVVRHEVLHIVLAEMGEVFEKVARQLSSSTSGMVREAYNDAEERAIQRITRGLALYDQRQAAGRGQGKA